MPPRSPGCFGLALMATGLTAFAVGALLAVGSSIFLILAALGLAVFVGGMAIELRERLVNRANR